LFTKYNTPIIFARWKQLCACAHKLRKGPIVYTNKEQEAQLLPRKPLVLHCLE